MTDTLVRLSVNRNSSLVQSTSRASWWPSCAILKPLASHSCPFFCMCVFFVCVAIVARRRTLRPTWGHFRGRFLYFFVFVLSFRYIYIYIYKHIYIFWLLILKTDRRGREDESHPAAIKKRTVCDALGIFSTCVSIPYTVDSEEEEEDGRKYFFFVLRLLPMVFLK